MEKEQLLPAEKLQKFEYTSRGGPLFWKFLKIFEDSASVNVELYVI